MPPAHPELTKGMIPVRWVVKIGLKLLKTIRILIINGIIMIKI